MSLWADQTEKKPTQPSREEVEALCIVQVVARSACSFSDLAHSLGLARELAPAMEDAIAPLVAAGRLRSQEGIVAATDAGRTWLAAECARFGVTRLLDDAASP